MSKDHMLHFNNCYKEGVREGGRGEEGERGGRGERREERGQQGREGEGKKERGEKGERKERQGGERGREVDHDYKVQLDNTHNLPLYEYTVHLAKKLSLTQLSVDSALSISSLCNCSPTPPGFPNSATISLVRSNSSLLTRACKKGINNGIRVMQLWEPTSNITYSGKLCNNVNTMNQDFQYNLRNVESLRAKLRLDISIVQLRVEGHSHDNQKIPCLYLASC